MYKYIKRTIDFCIAFIALIILFVPLVIVAIIIKMDSDGPIIFKQQRLGKDGVPFYIWKFRSMCVGAEKQGTGVYSYKGDSRITKVGRIIRATSIDELPQLVNILKGEMSLIGPRPALWHQYDLIELRDQLTCTQGQAMTYEQSTLLLYNALRANTASGSAYGSSLGFTVSNGQVDTSSVLLKSRKGPFVAEEGTQLPFTPVSVYRNDKASASAELNKYDVYYYSESLQTVWIYTRRAAGRITAVSPSASAPTALTVAGSNYTLGSSAVASKISSLNGGGVGEVVTLLLGMDNEVADVITGEEADSVFYGVSTVRSVKTRSLLTPESAGTVGFAPGARSSLS